MAATPRRGVLRGPVRPVAVFVLSASLLSCVVGVREQRLPEYAKARVLGESQLNEEVMVRYRMLTPSDFRAAAPRPEMAAHAEEIGAYTCVGFPTRITQDVDIARDAAAGGFLATLRDADFFAIMDPSCSWWNPEGSSQPPEYVLEHEQIHFTLAEIEARKMRTKVRALEARGATEIEAANALKRAFDAAQTELMSAFLEITHRFDLDTSAKYQPRLQAKWRILAEARLARLPANPEPLPARTPAEPSEPTWEPL